MNSERLIITPKRARGDDGYRVFSIRIKEDTVSRIEDISAKTERSRNELINLLLEFALERCVIEGTE